MLLFLVGDNFFSLSFFLSFLSRIILSKDRQNVERLVRLLGEWKRFVSRDGMEVERELIIPR